MYNLSTKRILYVAYGGTSGAESDQKWCFVCAFISLVRKCIYVQSAHYLKAQSSLVTMMSNISVNSVFFGALGRQSGWLSEKSGFFAFSEQSGANLASSGIIAQPQQAQVEPNEKSSPESIDPGMAEIQAI